ncbi:MAG: isoprenyl transferase [Clostridia bacterium]|nr:isoprenyl transferase [Clostridia bacterium]MDD4145556.1 isoprenyl transferase [Clostridia bacterium]MDD4664968.1 isoprenyl transferase [Clostridia bacterium]
MRSFFKKFCKSAPHLTQQEIIKLPLPRHLAIIMDGNGRWAKKKGLPRAAGHRAGAETLRLIVETCLEVGMPYLTVYAFSTENWKRPPEEVKALMALLVEYIEKELQQLKQNGVKIKTIGNISELPSTAISRVQKAEKETAHNHKLVLQIALNYGGRKEILDAVKSIAGEVASGRLPVATIDTATMEEHLYTAGVPDPDLLIRTAGELRLSNFLLWQFAYTEFWFTEVFWPDFKVHHLYQAIYDYQYRQRRFGGLK